MLAENEMQILGMFGERLLIRKDDLRRMLREKGMSDGVSIANRLTERGYLKFIEAVGAPCYTITQDGIRFLKGV